MVATKTRVLGMLVTASLIGLVNVGTCDAGGIISAGSRGTLYYGGSNPWANSAGGTTIVGGGYVPAALFAPPAIPAPAIVAPPAPAAAPISYATDSTPAAPAVALRLTAAPMTAGVSLPPVATATPTTSYDAFINFGTGPYLDQALLTNGTAQSWTTSPSLVSAYGHVPTASELNDFSQTVLQRVESTFSNSGLAITATLDPSAKADHTLSVVSGLSAKTSPDAIGITSVGNNGFDFIDKLSYANSPDQLMWAVAHNVAHELMHAFGGEHHDTPAGNNLDAARSDWSVLVDPNTTFSAASVAEMRQNLREGGLATKYGTGAENLAHPVGCQCPQCQALELTTHPVPEPATVILWAAAAGIGAIVYRKKSPARGAA